jgi:hypothetical protein
VLGNDLRVLDLEVDVVDAEFVVEPANLLVNQGFRDPAAFCDVLLDCAVGQRNEQ